MFNDPVEDGIGCFMWVLVISFALAIMFTIASFIYQGIDRMSGTYAIKIAHVVDKYYVAERHETHYNPSTKTSSTDVIPEEWHVVIVFDQKSEQTDDVEVEKKTFHLLHPKDRCQVNVTVGKSGRIYIRSLGKLKQAEGM